MTQINILITGGCGFLGTAIISALLSKPHFSITALDINPPSLGSTTFSSTVRYVRANVLDPEALSKVFNEARPDIVIHTVGVSPVGAARYSMNGKEALFQINIEGTRNVVHAARECGAKGLVYTSSVTVVLDKLGADFRNVDETWPAGDVDTSYGLSKVGHLLPFLYRVSSWSLRRCQGRSRSAGSGSKYTHVRHVCPPLSTHLWARGHSYHTNHTRPRCSGSNTFHPRARHQSPGLRLHR
jgi:UDP-glucose 4-epimerase